MKERSKFVVEVFKSIGTGLIVAGIISIIFKKGTPEGIVAIVSGILLLLIGFVYLIKVEEVNG